MTRPQIRGSWGGRALLAMLGCLSCPALARADDCIPYLKNPALLITAPRSVLEDCARTPLAQGVLTALVGSAAGGVMATALGQALRQAARQQAQRAGERTAATAVAGAAPEHDRQEPADASEAEGEQTPPDGEPPVEPPPPDEPPEDLVEYDPPGDEPEDPPEEPDDESEHPQCDELYALLQDAIRRFREKQAERDAIKARFDSSMRIHQANQLKLIMRTGLDVGGIASAGVESIHLGAKNVGRAAQTISDDVRRARIKSEMLVEPIAELRRKMQMIDSALGAAGPAQAAVDRLTRESAELKSWFERTALERQYKHPFAALDDLERAEGLPKHPDYAGSIDYTEIETNRVARENLEEDIARQGFPATAEQRAKRAQLVRAFAEAREAVAKAEKEAFARGFTADLEPYLEKADPQKYARWQVVEKELAEARRQLQAAQDAQPDRLAERAELQARIDAMLDAEAGGSSAPRVSPDDARGQTPDASTRGPGREHDTVGLGRERPSWEAPKPPVWLHNMEEAVENGLATVLSPFTKAFRWAFGGQQSPEEVAKILADGKAHLEQLSADFEAKQAEIDAIRAEVDRLKADLEECNRRWRPRPVATAEPE